VKIIFDPLAGIFQFFASTTADIIDSLNKRYCTDAEKTVIGNTSGVNSGNETLTTVGALITGADEKTTPVDADLVGLSDSAAANILKKLSWTNVKATLKAYFDTIYAAIGAIPIYLTPANPTNLTSSSYTMFGLGGTIKITPLKSRKIRLTLTFFPTAVGTGSGMNNYKVAYGSGSAPANGAAATGTVVGGTYQGGGAIAVASTPPSIVRNIIVTGLVAGTQYWFDVQGAKNASYTSMGMSNIEATLQELPY
jgi:hypothetical protein